ncbi:hypothetical protein DFH27DRAFT_613145 [Peziza echinospora]|nr:hypothetical protein DFH27DRAFT_613145 [Peziza echinospora]
MPEVPVQMADNLEHLENVSRNPNVRQPPPGRYEPQQARVYSDNFSTVSGGSEYRDSYGYQQSIPQPTSDPYPSYDHYGHDDSQYSPFPRLINPGPNVPPTFEEKEMAVEHSRVEVLSSNDPELQLTWAYDALNHVEMSLAHLAKVSPDGQRPDTPELEHQIKTDAINVVGFLADQHHPRAEFMRGNWLEFGKFGFRVDKKEAFKCYSRAAERGYARAEYRMGMQFENSNEPMKAIKHYTQGAALGDSASNYRLGMMTLLGQHGQRQDYARGVHLIRLAAQTADENAPQGAYVYGMLLARELPGITVPEAFLPPDTRLAREMIEKAAYLGFARAQLKMGTAYELCQLGCDFNPALSLHYNALAAKQAEPEAEMAISKWFLCGHENVFEKNEELAFVYAQRAALSGLATAEFALGYFFEIGMYVQVDLQEAKAWYSKAAAHGNKDASSRIDGISRSKTLSRKDHENIAISKIKARHASQRQKTNPITERQRAAGNMGSLPEAVDMPDPNVPHDYPPMPVMPNIAQLQQQFPPRSSSAQSGKINPGFINPNLLPQNQGGYLEPAYGNNLPPQRPGSAAPYPIDGPGPMNGNFPFPARSTSAASHSGPGPQGRPFSPPGSQAPRPMSAIVYPHTNIPPAGAYPQGNQGPGQNRPFNASPGPQKNGPPGRPNMGPGQQSYGGYDQNGPRPGSGGNGQRPPPQVSLGFEAPEPRPKPAPTPQPQKQIQQQYQQQQQQRPPPQQQQQQHQQQPQYSQPPPQQQQQPRPQPAPTPKPAAVPAGKGPKTFEEMGVQAQKKEEECVIM